LKLPNNYGNISKLSGKRRNPWRVRKTTGWVVNETTGKRKQQFHNIGYYKTRQDAIRALAEYNADPYAIDNNTTFEELYAKWNSQKFTVLSKSAIKSHNAAFAACAPLHKLKFAHLRLPHLQDLVDTCGKNHPSLIRIKVLFNQLYVYAIQNEICHRNYASFVDIARHKERGHKDKIHKPFNDAEIAALWDNKKDECVQIILMMIYSGVRVSELLNLKKCNVHLKDRYFDIIDSKTEAGVRSVPIAAKILPFFKRWMKRKSEYLLSGSGGKPFTYHHFFVSHWKRLFRKLGIDHLPHDTRYTTVSLLAKANVNQTIIKKIVGHSRAQSLTERVYTHFNIQHLVDAIDLI